MRLSTLATAFLALALAAFALFHLLEISGRDRRLATLQEERDRFARDHDAILEEARALLRAPARREAERLLAETPAPSPAPASDARPPEIGPEAVALILEFEVTSRALYEQSRRTPLRPVNGGGVTIGVGYDLGWRTAEEIRSAWSALGAPSVDRLTRLAERRGEAADKAYAEVADIEIPYETALAVFRAVTLPRAAAETARVFPGAVDLPPDSFGALASLVMNRGPSLDAPDGDARREMRAIRDLLAARRPEAVPAQIRAMKWLWWRSALPGLMRRREREAALFEKGLAARASN